MANQVFGEIGKAHAILSDPAERRDYDARLATDATDIDANRLAQAETLYLKAEVLIKGTHSGVDGVYSADPRVDDSATKYTTISYIDVMTKDLKVMDATAIAFCRDNEIPIVVFDMSKQGSLRSIVQGGSEGTLIAE